MKKHVFLFLLFSFGFVFSCKKDSVEPPLLKENSSPISSTQGGKKVNIEEAKEIYKRAFGNRSTLQSRSQFENFTGNEFGEFEPIWFLAKEIPVLGEGSIVIVPAKIPEGASLNDGQGVQWVFFANDSCSTPMELVVYEAQDPTKLDNCSFSGAIANINFCTCLSLKYYIENGQIIFSEEITESDLPPLGGSITDRDDEEDDPENEGCGETDWHRFWRRFGQFFVNLWNWFGANHGGGTGNTNWWNGGGTFPDYFNHYGNNPNGGGGGGSTGVMTSIFNGTFFNGQGQTVLNKLNNIIAAHDLFVCVEDLHADLYHCLATNHNDPDEQCGGFHVNPDDPNANPNVDELTIPEYIAFLNNLGGNAADCLAAVEQSYDSNIDMGSGDGELLCLIQANDYGDVPDEVVYNLIQTNGCYVNGYLDLECVEEALVAYVLSQFLDNENYSQEAQLAANTLQQIQLNSGGELTATELLDILNAFELFFDNPIGNEEALVDAMLENGLNPLSTSTTLDALIEESAPIPPSPPGTPMTPQVFWQKAGTIKQTLLNKYPNKTDKIDDMFPCRVMGPAFEEAGLASLGLPKNTVNVGGAIPDAMVNITMGGGEPPATHQQPNIIELKCRLGSTFDYSGQTNQLNAYLNYLQTNAFWSNTTIIHGLYLIVPDDVSIGQNIIDAANAKNVPLLVSSVSLGNNDVTQFKVNDLEFVKQMWYWLPDGFFAWTRKKGMKEKLDYEPAFIDFQKHANAFEQSHLIGNSNEGCPQD
jgi:hypothetical protein